MPRVSYRVTKAGGESLRSCAEQARIMFLEDWSPEHWHLEDVQQGYTDSAGHFVRVEFSFHPGDYWASADMHEHQ